ncbi:MAG: CTP synthase [Treponema sp.]|nr:CTP synthase [Treponema sp.]
MDRQKIVFVTGGVISGLGKGITAASLGRLLKQRSLKVSVIKLDPYMNVDPGTMNPFQHGEIFVTEDGAETDLDLGHYERFIDENLSRFSSLTSGMVHWNVLHKEREGHYTGNTVQVVPHITGEIKAFIYQGMKESGADVIIAEIGGTIGDIEGRPFIEAIRQISMEHGREHCLFIHVTLVPYIKSIGEHKSKPTQHSVKELQSMGISPDIIVLRSDESMPKSLAEKIVLFCNVKSDCVIENNTVSSLYEVPLMLNQKGLDKVVCRELGLLTQEPDLSAWNNLIAKINNRKNELSIAIVGKYTKLHDAYLSIIESLHHAGFDLGFHINIVWIDSEEVLSKDGLHLLSAADGLIIPGGFGERGIEGKIAACRYAREKDLPFLGICLGLQIAVIEYARNVCGIEKAHSSEFAAGDFEPLIHHMADQIDKVNSGGTMRLGSYPCSIAKGTKLYETYGKESVDERHRHRFEVNNQYREVLTQRGLSLSGFSPCGKLVEAVEISGKAFFIGVQFHPEYKSRPNRPHPLFLGLLKESFKRKAANGMHH